MFQFKVNLKIEQVIPRDNLRSPISNVNQKKTVVHRLKLKKVDVNYKTVFKVVEQAGQQVDGVGVGAERDI